MNLDRIAQIRTESESEHRTHEWADRVIDELLATAEQAADLRFAATTAAMLLRDAAEAIETGRRPDPARYRSAARTVDEIAAR